MGKEVYLMEVVKIVNGKLKGNAYLIYDENRVGAIIDPGEQPERIINEVKARGVNVTHILLTHGHFDHITSTDIIKKEFDAKVCIHEKDAAALSDPELNLSGRFAEEVRLTPADIILKDGDELKIGSMDIKVIYTPGHSEGSCSFVVEHNVFSGDTLFYLSIGRSDLVGGSERDLQESLDRLAKLPGDYMVYPGHGETTTISFERENNEYMRSSRI